MLRKNTALFFAAALLVVAAAVAHAQNPSVRSGEPGFDAPAAHAMVAGAQDRQGGLLTSRVVCLMVTSEPPPMIGPDSELPTSGEDFDHLRLSLTPTSSRDAADGGLATWATWAVNALKRGQVAGIGYIDTLSGTATLAPSNDPTVMTPVVQVNLAGNGYGVIDGGEPGIWSLDYNLQLDPATFTGMLFGSELESEPLVEGASFVGQRRAVVRHVFPLDCAAF
jgi:hypothetical protein